MIRKCYKIQQLTIDKRDEYARLTRESKGYRKAMKDLKKLIAELQATTHDKHESAIFDDALHDLELKIIGVEARMGRIEILGR